MDIEIRDLQGGRLGAPFDMSDAEMVDIVDCLDAGDSRSPARDKLDSKKSGHAGLDEERVKIGLNVTRSFCALLPRQAERVCAEVEEECLAREVCAIVRKGFAERRVTGSCLSDLCAVSATGISLGPDLFQRKQAVCVYRSVDVGRGAVESGAGLCGISSSLASAYMSTLAARVGFPKTW